MSSGFLKAQKSGQHQVMIFTFVGPISDADRKAWNQCIRDLKERLGGRLVGVTIKGDKSPRTPKKPKGRR